MAIVAKKKEPHLSQALQDIINRSHGDGGGECYDDNERYKYRIMKMLTENQDVLWTLHNKELEEKYSYTTKDETGNEIVMLNGDTYRDVSIFNFLKIPGIQSTVKNFICFEVNDVEQPRYNKDLIIKNIIFRTVSHDDNYITDWGIARQDLLALIIQSEFDWTNIFGLHLEKIADRGKVADNGYYYREFVYETTIPNNLVNKAKNGGVTWNGRK